MPKSSGVALELGLHREGLDLLGRVPGDEHLLGRLQDVLVLGGEVAAGRVRWRRPGQQRQASQRDRDSLAVLSHGSSFLTNECASSTLRERASASLATTRKKPFPLRPGVTCERRRSRQRHADHGGEVGRISSYSDVVLLLAEPGRDDLQVVVHLVRVKILRNLVMNRPSCRWPAGAQCARRRRSLADQVAEGAFLAALARRARITLKIASACCGSFRSAWVKPSSTLGTFSL